MEQYQDSRVPDWIKEVPEYRRVLFGISLLARMVPNYVAYCASGNDGDDRALSGALDIAWRGWLGEDVAHEARAARALIEKLVPDPDEVEHPLVPCAQESCFAAILLMDYVASPDVDLLARIRRFALDSIDYYVQESEALEMGDPALEEKILAHPLMQAELSKQRKDLRALSELAPLPSAAEVWLVQEGSLKL